MFMKEFSMSLSLVINSYGNMLAPGNSFSTGGTKNTPDAKTENSLFMFWDKPWPPKLLFPSQLGSVNIKNNLPGSFWKLIKFSPTLKGFAGLEFRGSINS